MNQSPGRFVKPAAIAGIGIAGVLGAHLIFAGQGQPRSGAGKPPAGADPLSALAPYVEAHTHFDSVDPDGAVRSALAALGRQNAAMIFFQMPPDTFAHPGRYDAEVLLSAAQKYPGKLAVLGGGGTLNAMISNRWRLAMRAPPCRKNLGSAPRNFFARALSDSEK